MHKKKQTHKYRRKYDPIHTPKQVYTLARKGHNNKEISQAIGCTDSTFSTWANNKPEIADALREGRAFILPELEKSMIKSALGYSVDEVTTKFTARPNRSNSGPDFVPAGKSVTTKHYPPNVQMQKYLANNLHPDLYKEKSEVVVEIKDITDEDIEAFEKALLR